MEHCFLYDIEAYSMVTSLYSALSQRRFGGNVLTVTGQGKGYSAGHIVQFHHQLVETAVGSLGWSAEAGRSRTTFASMARLAHFVVMIKHEVHQVWSLNS